MRNNIADLLEEINSLPLEEKKKLDAEVLDRWYRLSRNINYYMITSKDMQGLRISIYLEQKHLKQQQNQG